MVGRLPPLILLALLASLGGCMGKKKTLKTPEEAFAAITTAAGEGDKGGAKIYTLIDEMTRWSAISAHKDLRTICTLISSRYPEHSKQREMRRCNLAARAKTTKAWFAAHARRERLLAPLAKCKRVEGRSGGGDQVVLVSCARKLTFCKEESSWTYCGLRAHFEQLKLKAARDLTTTRENAEAYKQGR